MSSIFIVGATGFIGLPVATALRRAGYLVYGLARSAEKAKILAQNEIIPIQGDIKNLAEIVPRTVEIIIDVSGLYHEAVVLLEQSKKIGAGRKPTDPKLGFIYTSGMWVHGSSSTDLVSEATPLGLHTKAAELVAWRPELENQILASKDVLDVAVIRPACLYGGDGTIWKGWLEPVRKAATENTAASIFGEPNTIVALVHKDDLADVYVRLVERFTVIAASTHPVIDASSHQELLGEVVTAFAKAIKFQGQITYRAPANSFEQAMLTELNVRPNKARGLLGWVPKQIPFAQGMQIYAEAYIALN